ncbi:methylaspartate mutase [Sphaerisporangium sp. TRM90804]|uniref:methylaspartate mutase n=1 Tax=Sphaerisporangium sp. TRM90804 TaxID=3031113 RepID=UPI00244CA660|nr:methylaspartate mutase [Sphaerisporangium sp. TRM90804]MDH2430871.1 methylaspartate mutase [Sphaerisporangium sp. TRM90804]
MSFGEFVRRNRERGVLVVQPRMGFSDPRVMRAGLVATRDARATTVGTLTLDSYTRVGDHGSAARALRDGVALNGYPIVAHPPDTTRRMLGGVRSDAFPVQVRHGSPRPLDIFAAMAAAGLGDTEGGPVSYCLPYGRAPLDESVANWRASCRLLLESAVEPHLETFGGCMMGQLCPPSQLVAISALEGLFFRQQGVRSISVSYAQQTNPAQDREAVHALRGLCARLLPDVDWHVVVYTYMGMYPRTAGGALGLLTGAATLALSTGAERLIVKTVAESQRIPTIAENVAALEHAAGVPAGAAPEPAAAAGGEVYQEAYAMVEAVLNCDADVGNALVQAFKRGLLDIPYCVHPDNAGRARSYITADGRLRWADTGSLPLAGGGGAARRGGLTSAEFMSALTYVQNRYDTEAMAARSSAALPYVFPGRII